MAITTICLIIAASIPAQEWTRFRGPNGTGIGEAPAVPGAWTEADLDWKTDLPGLGHSSPVLWGDAVFLTSAEEAGARRLVLRIRAADGSVDWIRRIESHTSTKHVRNSYASSTPAADDERVYSIFWTPESLLVLAHDHAGKEAWRRDLGPFKSQHGHGSSPIVFEGLLIVPDEQDGESAIVALDRKTGSVAWKTPRKSAEVAYATPCIVDEAGRPSLVLASHAHGIAALDARTGAPLWESKVFDRRVVSSPLVADGLVFGTCGEGGVGSMYAAVRSSGKDGEAAGDVAWKLERAVPYVPTSIALGGLLFLWSDIGAVTCVETATGKTVWQQRVAGNYSGSPVIATGGKDGDRLFIISDDGEAICIAAGREFKLLGRTPLGGPSRSTPAIAGGRLFLRTESRLFAVGGKGASSGGGSAK